ncbi:hypothetical protein [Bradyrhizobium sp. JR18.2]|uniref:hypothetical protein n=1 Tax=Bradyrhizobium sp. JR18.2 TaxID=3156369 RepID=UPI0033908F8C
MTKLSIWQEVLTEGARLKKGQLDREIGQLKDPLERANLGHTYSKLMMFMAEDIERLKRKADRLEKESQQWQMIVVNLESQLNASQGDRRMQ